MMKNNEKYTNTYIRFMNRMTEYIKREQHQIIDSYHLLYFLIEQDGIIENILQLAQANPQRLREKLENQLKLHPRVVNFNAQQVNYSKHARAVIRRHKVLARQMGDSYISVEHLLLALSETGGPFVEKLMHKENLTPQNIRHFITRVRGNQKSDSLFPETKYNALQRYTLNLNQLAKEGKLDPVIGREKEIQRVIRTLSRRKKNNALLIGEPGVGKTAIAEGLAIHIVNGHVPLLLQHKQILALDLAAMLAGTRYRGEFEERMKALLEELEKLQGNAILFIDEMHTLISTGNRSGGMDAANILKPALARGEIQVIGATTIEDYRQFIEKDAALERRFQPILIEEPTAAQTLEILKGLRSYYEIHHGVIIEDSAMEAATRLAQRYISERFLPDKAIDLLDEACARKALDFNSLPETILRMEQQLTADKLPATKEKTLRQQLEQLQKNRDDFQENVKQIIELKNHMLDLQKQLFVLEKEKAFEEIREIKNRQLPETENELKKRTQTLRQQLNPDFPSPFVTEDDVVNIVSDWIGIDADRLRHSADEKVARLQNVLNSRVIGQPEAVQAIADAIHQGYFQTAESRRPIASFVFVGPIGVGKTTTAQALAEALFDDPKAFVQLDMSEFMERHSVARLIGAPPGYIGFEQGGLLTEHVRLRPYSVVLFDDVNRAHPDVLNILMQVLEEGRLRDGKGRTINFRNTIIILSFTIPFEPIARALKKEADVQTALRKVWASFLQQVQHSSHPELFNRADELLFFKPFDRQDLQPLTRLLLEQALIPFRQRNIPVHYTPAVIKHIARKGYQAEFGARSIRQYIRHYITTPALKQIMANTHTIEHLQIKTAKSDGLRVEVHLK